MKVITVTLLGFMLVGCAGAQVPFNRVNINPISGTSTPGYINFASSSAAFGVKVQAQSGMSTNIIFGLPMATGTVGQCLVADGSGNWNPGSCSSTLTPPITFSGTSASPILTVTQLGAGRSISTSGPDRLGGALEVVGITTLDTTTHIGGLTDINLSSSSAILTLTNTLSGTGGGIALNATSNGSLSYTLQADNAGGGPSAHFIRGNVLVDNVLTATLGIISNGGVFAATGINTSTGSNTGTHMQNVGTGDSPTFSGLTLTGSNSTFLNLITQSGSGGGLSITSSSSTAPFYGLSISNFGTADALHVGTGNTSLGGALAVSGVTTATNDINIKSEDHFLSVDATSNSRLGMTKKFGFDPFVSFSSGIDFAVYQSNTSSVASVNTFSRKFSIDKTTGVVDAVNGFSSGGSVGITGSTCSHWTGGICDTP